MTNEAKTSADQLKAERDRYKLLASQALIDLAMKRAFEAAGKAAVKVMTSLPVDELEAFERGIGMTVEEGLKKGLTLTFNKQVIEIKME